MAASCSNILMCLSVIKFYSFEILSCCKKTTMGLRISRLVQKTRRLILTTTLTKQRSGFVLDVNVSCWPLSVFLKHQRRLTNLACFSLSKDFLYWLSSFQVKRREHRPYERRWKSYHNFMQSRLFDGGVYDLALTR